jgi:hypothetical protein
VRHGYDAISRVCRSDEGTANAATDEHTDNYERWFHVPVPDQRKLFPKIRRWLAEAGLVPLWDRFVPEGDVGHTLALAQAV